MTATELLQLIWASGGDPDDPHADPVGKTKLCLKAIDEDRTEQWRLALLAAAKHSFYSDHLTEIANDPELLQKFMEEADK